MNEQSYFRVSVKGIAVDDTGRFLLVREKNGLWDMLGGGLDHGEDPVQGLRREVQEEAGLAVTWVSPTPKYFLTSPQFSRPSYYVANVVYEIKVKDLNFRQSDECEEIKFFTPEEARGLKLFPTAELLLDVYNPRLHAQQHIGAIG